VKIILLSEDAIRLEPIPGSMTIEAVSAEQMYSPFQMVASGLAYCTYSVMSAWATHAGLVANDLAIEVRWTFEEDPHRMDTIQLQFEWPSLPAKRYEAARRVAEMCTIHATLQHPPKITIAPLAGSTRSTEPVPAHQGAA
jgi:uncharacterized OsmC-like protein